MADVLTIIRRAVETSGRSRYQLAKESGVSQASLCRLVNGERGMTVDMLERLAPALGLEIIIRPKRRKAR